jgi:hypothetical protein
MVSVVCVEFAENATANAISRLLLSEKADLPNGRRSFFVCSECGDLGCGAITAVVVPGLGWLNASAGTSGYWKCSTSMMSLSVSSICE